jgi:hypothetical protein
MLAIERQLRRGPAMAATKKAMTEKIVKIFARVLGNGRKKLPPEIARYILGRGFSEKDKSRMHDLAARNQEDRLTEAERAEMIAFARAGTILGILQAKARLSLQSKAKKRTKGRGRQKA